MAAITGAYFSGYSLRRRTPPLSKARAVAADRKVEKLTENGVEVLSSATEKKVLEVEDEERMSLHDYFHQTKELIRSDGENSPPRWFSPLECGSRIDNSPLLLYLPGFDGVGLGLIRQHKKLGNFFDIWCLHIPVKDRTPFEELVLLVEETVRSENHRCSDRPIYMVGESIGGCLALAVAARNPNIDLVLILVNPATSYNKSQLQSIIPLLEFAPTELPLTSPPSMLRIMTGEPLKMALFGLESRHELQQTLEQLSQGLHELSSDLSVLAEILSKETLKWKLTMAKSACLYATSRLHAVKAQILILASGNDPLMPNLEEAERIRGALPKQEIRILKDAGEMPRCQIRTFNESGHFLFLEDDVDLAMIIKGTDLYRRGSYHDYISDFLPPTESEFNKLTESYKWLEVATGPVMLSTMEDGNIVRGLKGIPLQGPVVLVGYHMLLGVDIYPLVIKLLKERNILLRGLAHPMLFVKMQENELDLCMFDAFRVMGAVPVTPTNFYKLLSSGSHVLLYPGGVREACHQKGEGYQLFWPERSEFVRMAARFGAKIVPFGAVGEDDIFELVADYEDLQKIPFLREHIEQEANRLIRVRTDAEGEVANETAYFPGVIPKIPGRFYFLFGKPIDTAVMKQELRDKEKAHELYLHVKSEVEHCISYLKEKRGKDPYRSIATRTLYQATRCDWTSEAPTFELQLNGSMMELEAS